MSDTEHDEMFETLASDLRAMPARIWRFREEERAAVDAKNRVLGEIALARQEHDQWIDASTARHKAECEARKRELAGREFCPCRARKDVGGGASPG